MEEPSFRRKEESTVVPIGFEENRFTQNVQRLFPTKPYRATKVYGLKEIVGNM
jgi:hypothetical protein